MENLEKNLDMVDGEEGGGVESGWPDAYKEGAGDMMNFRLVPTVGSFGSEHGGRDPVQIVVFQSVDGD